MDSVRTVVLLGLVANLASCSWLPWRDDGPRCREPAVPETVGKLPPLVVPEGLDAPDTRAAIQIAELPENAARPAAGAPCLSTPPDYNN